MKFVSTRDNSKKVSAAEAIVAGLAPDGGLFTPEYIPAFEEGKIKELCRMGYEERAAEIMGMYLTDFTKDELLDCAAKAYGSGRFPKGEPAPVKKLKDNAYILELWHGPTCAFKDMALQILPHLLTASLKKVGEKKTVCILVATSGDTGKAALEGFRDVAGTKILVFYPNNGVSAVQKLQMTSQKGENVGVCAINGNFDDAQTAVKNIFSDRAFAEKAAKSNIFFSSANSINWGRLVPQIVYYVSAYCDLINSGEITEGEEINVTVPTGNFGNILAAYFAKKMRIPIKTLICASNSNNVLTDFFNKDGYYNADRKFFTTISPSMDILISSNLERLLYYINDCDDRKTAGLMQKLKTDRSYKIEGDAAKAVSKEFFAGCLNDADTKKVINNLFCESKYLCDTHTAVAVGVYEDYVKNTGDATKTIIASTANPYKFVASVLDALGEKAADNEIEAIDKLEQVTGTKAPAPIAALKEAKERFDGVCNREDILAVTERMMGIK